MNTDSRGAGARRITGIDDHPLREALIEEVHARPFERLSAPARASFLGVLSGEDAAARDRAHVAALCRRFDAPPPAPDANHLSIGLPGFRLRWERHTEFSSYTFLTAGPFEAPFDAPPIARVPPEWLAALEGTTLVALHAALLPRDRTPPDAEGVAACFDGNTVAGSRVAGGAAVAWTDYRVHADGFGRVLVQDHALGSRQAGRLLQRMFEIETYRMLALLALPLAREHGPSVGRVGGQLAQLTRRLAGTLEPQDEKRLLGDLTRLAAEVEDIGAQTAYRFSAARAYRALVERRIEELREERIQGLQTFREFMDRRLTPAMNTCEWMQQRLADLSARITRAADLLRTRVNVHLEEQNRDLLRSMDRRALLQLRLQETVEGLSVVVLSYYLLGLLAYGFKALRGAGLPLDLDLATGIALPLVVLAVFVAMRRLRNRGVAGTQ